MHSFYKDFQDFIIVYLLLLIKKTNNFRLKVKQAVSEHIRNVGGKHKAIQAKHYKTLTVKHIFLFRCLDTGPYWHLPVLSNEPKTKYLKTYKVAQA